MGSPIGRRDGFENGVVLRPGLKPDGKDTEVFRLTQDLECYL
jgi:hypothetical protein